MLFMRVCLCRSNTIGLMALWLVNLSYASYLVMLQHVLSKRPYPFSLYSCASIFGDVGIILAALPQFRQVMLTIVMPAAANDAVS